MWGLGRVENCHAKASRARAQPRTSDSELETKGLLGLHLFPSSSLAFPVLKSRRLLHPPLLTH